MLKFWFEILLKFLGLILFQFFLSTNLFSQNFEWVNSFFSKYGRENVISVSTNPEGGCTFLLHHLNGGTKSDTLSIGYYNYIYQASNEVINFLVRVDSIGRVVKVKLLCKGNGINKGKICRDNIGNCYISRPFTSKFDSISLNSVNGGIIFAKYNSDFDLLWINQTGASTDTPSDLFFSDSHVLFTCQSFDFLSHSYSTFFGFIMIHIW